MTDGSYGLLPIGWVESPLVDPATAPKQGEEGSPEAWLVFEKAVSEGFRDLQVGTEVKPGRPDPHSAGSAGLFGAF